MTFQRNCLSKAPLPSTITQGLDFNIWVLRRTQTLIHNSRYLISNFWIRKSEWIIMLEDFGYHVLSWPVLTSRKTEHAPTQSVLIYAVVSCCHVQFFCDPMDCSLPSSSVHGISQARILGWAAISFSKGSSQHRDQTQVSCPEGGFFMLSHQENPH